MFASSCKSCLGTELGKAGLATQIRLEPGRTLLERYTKVYVE
jgi:hypothetical protein